MDLNEFLEATLEAPGHSFPVRAYVEGARFQPLVRLSGEDD